MEFHHILYSLESYEHIIYNIFVVSMCWEMRSFYIYNVGVSITELLPQMNLVNGIVLFVINY